MSRTPNVGIVVLNWNNAADTLRCLSSLERLEYSNCSVEVVDNGSTDDSVKEICSAFPGTKILKLPSNSGFAAANNLGINNALHRGADYVLLLNNDTLLDPELLTLLVQFAEIRPNAGLIGPSTYRMAPSDRLFAAGGAIRWSTGETMNTEKLSKSPQMVDYIPGCGVLVRRAVFEQAGGMDVEYFLNFEDVEWAVRARRFGFTTWCVPQARMWHKVSATLGQASPMNTYYMTRNSLRFFWTNAPVHLKLSAVAAIGIRTLRTILAWTLRSKYGKGFHKQRNANLLALRDFLLGRSGEMGQDVAVLCR